MKSGHGIQTSSPIRDVECERIVDILANPPNLSYAERMAMWAALRYAPRLNRMSAASLTDQPMLALVPPRKGAA